MSISLLNIDRFSQFFHRRTQLELCNKIINKDPTSPQVRYSFCLPTVVPILHRFQACFIDHNHWQTDNIDTYSMGKTIHFGNESFLVGGGILQFQNGNSHWPWSQFKVINLGANQKRICNFLLVINSNFWHISTIFEISFQCFCSKIARIPQTTLDGAP